MNTPLVLIDIDGVLNAFRAPTHRIGQQLLASNSHQRVDVAGRYTVVLDKRHPEWMRELEKRGDVRWATMWMHNAAPVFGAVAGIGQDWDFIDFVEHNNYAPRARTGAGVVNYKWQGILATVGEDQPLVYVDDDMQPAHHDWAAMRNEAGIPTLFIQPDPKDGLTRKQFDRVVAFLDALVPATTTV